MDFDRVLEKCGSFGRFQFVILVLYGYTNILSSLHYFSQTLITFTPEHWSVLCEIIVCKNNLIKSWYIGVLIMIWKDSAQNRFAPSLQMFHIHLVQYLME